MPDKFPIVPPLDWAAPYIGTPWKWQGADPTAFDCAGWLHWAWTRHWGVNLPNWQADQTSGGDYHRTKQAARLIAHFLQDCVSIDVPIPGAGVLMLRGRVANHVGLYERGGDILHACETAGQLVREPRDDLKSRIQGYYLPKQGRLP